MGIAGWLWADLLLGAFVIFAVANTGGPGSMERSAVAASASPAATTPSKPVETFTPTAVPSAAAPGIDPLPLQITIPIDGGALLSADPRSVAVQQERVLVTATQAAGSRRVALVFAYGTSRDAATGERLASLATALLRSGVFEGAALNTFHNLVAGDTGSSVLLSMYFYR